MKKTDKIAKLLSKKEIHFPYYFYQLDETSKKDYNEMLIRNFKTDNFNGFFIIQSSYKKHISRVII